MNTLFECKVLEWSKGGRAKIKYALGSEGWIEGEDLPEVVEVLA